MRALVLGLFLSMAVLFPKSGNAQLAGFRTPPPEVTAAGADWQIGGAPVLVDGVVFYPTHGFRFFDGNVMTQVGVYRGVPVYADATIEPNSVLYVPIGRDRMREYERRRDRELAGTTGSRVPAYPVLSPSETTRPDRAVAIDAAAVGATGELTPSRIEYVSDGRAHRFVPIDTIGTTGTVGGDGRTSLIESIARPSATNGVWVEFAGARWYSAGISEPFTPDRFEPVGMYRGFAVYRETGGNADHIWVSAVADGPLAPYRRK